MVDILICGEAYGKDEEMAEKPFVGASGRLLSALLSQAGIARSECYVTNVFNLRPQSNDVKNLCGKKAEGIEGWPSIAQGKYVLAKYKPHLDRLFAEVECERPNLILALGASAAWAFLKSSGIKAIRGAPAESWFDNYKVLPTYHPAAVLRDYSLRPILYADLVKAKREAAYPEIRRPMREVWIEPDLHDLWQFKLKHIDPSRFLSIDIETTGDQITCIGFAPTKKIALVVPFVDPTKPKRNYWETKEEELEAWRFVREICALDKVIVGQNFTYDMQFLLRSYGIPVPHASEDTMLLHHALQPEMQKGLGFLASIYTDEASWKFMRKANTTVKREDD